MLLVHRVPEDGHRYYLGAVGPSRRSAPEHGEAPGSWLGEGGAVLGRGPGVEVDGADLGRLLAGAHPDLGHPMVVRRVRRLAGLDLLFAAPKSISVAHGLDGGALSTGLACAHDRAVVEALNYLEHHACVVRQGPARRAYGQGLLAAGFRHRTSRADDPHLHTHVVTPNLAAGPGGRFSALHTPILFNELRTAGAVYGAALRHHVGALDLAWARVDGRWELAGVPRSVIELFSRRHAQIMAFQAGAGAGVGPRAAARLTRPPKVGLVDYPILVESWRTAAIENGFDLGRAVAARPSPVPPDERLLRGLGDVFGRSEVLRAWCDAAPNGATRAEAERAAATVLRDGGVPLGGRGGTGRRDGPAGAELRYTTPEVLAQRRELLDGPAIGVVVGTTAERTDALDRLRSFTQARGAVIVAVARTRVSAVDVEAATGIPTDQGAFRAGDPPSLVVVADAHRWDTPGLAVVVGAARAVRASVVLAGDSGRGAEAFAAMVADLDPVTAPAVGPAAALATVGLGTGTLTMATSAEELRRVLVADWTSAREAGRPAVLVARHREDVAALNALIDPGSPGAVLAGDAWRSGPGEAFVLGVRAPRRGAAGDAPAHLYVVGGPAATADGTAALRYADLTVLDAKSRELEPVLAERPPDRGALLAELDRRLGEARHWRDEAGARAAQASRWSGRLDPTWAGQVDRAAREIAFLERDRGAAAQVAVDRALWLRDHKGVLAEAGTIGRQTGLRATALARAAEQAPPEWLVAVVGAPPTSALPRDAWRRAAGAVAAHRERWGIDDQWRAFGGPSPTGEQQLQRRRVEAALRRALPDMGRGIEGPGLER